MGIISRRSFLRKSVLGTVLVSSGLFTQRRLIAAGDERIDTVELGKTGIKVSRLAWGTGTKGTKFQSRQTKLGLKEFHKIADCALACGINFFDSADQYGTHSYFRAALKKYPRDKFILLTKMWTQPSEWMKTLTATRFLEIFLEELAMDYIDIVLLHGMTSADWPAEMESFCLELSRAKEKGIIRAHGVSCHSLEALKTAAQSEWVDILLARINNIGARMDDKPDVVMPILKQAHDAGKGVLGMKVYGCGELIKEEQREGSLKFVLGSGNVDALTIGFENVEQIADTIKRINRMVNEKKSN